MKLFYSIFCEMLFHFTKYHLTEMYIHCSFIFRHSSNKRDIQTGHQSQELLKVVKRLCSNSSLLNGPNLAHKKDLDKPSRTKLVSQAFIGSTDYITKFHCFMTHFISISCSSKTTQKLHVGLKYTFSNSPLQDQLRN